MLIRTIYNIAININILDESNVPENVQPAQFLSDYTVQQVEKLILIWRQTVLAVKCKGKSLLILPFGYGKNTFTISIPTNYAKISLETITWLGIW